MTQERTLSHELAQNLLHVIANESDASKAFAPVLQRLRSFAGAEAAALVLFEEPALEVTDPPGSAVLNNALVLRTAIASIKDQSCGMILANRDEALPVGLDAEALDLSCVVLDVGTALIGAPWVIIPLHGTEPSDSVVGMRFSSLDDISGLTQADLDLLRDTLSLLVRIVRREAYHAKISRNQSEFLRIVAHDLRSPLAYMQGFASMLESSMVGELNEKQDHYVQKILSGVAQMTSLVDNIQDAGRFDPETGFYEMERTPCDLNEIVHGIVNGQLVPAEKQELSVTTALADDLPIISADSRMLERAITNLIDNAIKYTPNGGEIKVSVTQIDGAIQISVADTGYGISPENQKMLFERHVRIPRKEHKRVKGSGLGLFIVRSVARRHGGDAWVESVLDQGSVFYIRIPLDAESSIVT